MHYDSIINSQLIIDIKPYETTYYSKPGYSNYQLQNVYGIEDHIDFRFYWRKKSFRLINSPIEI
jgi:hypothetical protein